MNGSILSMDGGWVAQSARPPTGGRQATGRAVAFVSDTLEFEPDRGTITQPLS